MLNHKKLRCLDTGALLDDDGLILENPGATKPALIRTEYTNAQLEVKNDLPGIFRFSDWLPISRILKSEGAPVTYKSLGLGKHLGLSNLFVTFNGYWPQVGANLKTGTFKECEAYAVCARHPIDQGTLVLASAGNTARAFMAVATENKIPTVIVVPEQYLSSLWTIDPLDPCVKIVAAGGDSDYYDAIRLSGVIAGLDGFVNEGGAKNVARRDGMGTTVLSAATTIGAIPDYYFQAVGSGTGAIAAHEAALRLNASGQFEPKTMRLCISQNSPFTPIAQAWAKKSRTLDPIDDDEAQRQIEEIVSKVLSNRQPPYGITGGLYDALEASGGDVISVTNEQIFSAQRLFEDKEGCDISPEAGAALASLLQKLKDGAIEKDAVIMLNVTGGGTAALARDYQLLYAGADLVIPREEIGTQGALDKIQSLF